MNQYVDAFVVPVPRDKVPQYLELARMAAAVWREHGALEYRECLGDDLQIEGVLPFPQMAGCGPDETVFFSWAVFASKEARDAANAKIHTDPRLREICGSADLPFDVKRMAYGGFQVAVQA